MTKGLIISAIMLSSVATMFTGCVAEEDVAMSYEDSLRLSVSFNGTLENYARPDSRRFMSMSRTRGKDACTIEEVAQPRMTWWSTRNTVDSLSNWNGMSNRKMSVMIGSVIYGNFLVDETGHIKASMGPFVFDDGSSSTASVQAWYPSTGTKDLDTFSVQRNQSYFSKLEASDLLYGKQVVVGTAKEIHFKHKMSQIELHVKVLRYYSDGTVRDTIPSKIKSVKLGGVYTSGHINRGNFYADMTGTVVDSASLDTISICHYPDSDMYVENEVGDTDTVFCYKGIIFPQKKSFSIILDVSGKLYSGEVEDYKYREGVLYNVIVNLTEQAEVRVGDYLYCNTDGDIICKNAEAAPDLYGDGFVPIAVVFSDCPTYADQARGWNRGYAMSLATVNNNTNYQWCNTYGYNNQQVQYGNNWKMAVMQYNGYDETYFIINDTNSLPKPHNIATFPAFFRTVNWAPTYNPNKEETSGWFIPSAGQWYQFLIKLGEPTNITTVYGDPNRYWPDQRWIIQGNLNAYFTAVEPYLPPYANKFGNDQYYWTSSEYHANHANYVWFYSNSNMHFYYNTEQTKNASMKIRPCIAF